MDLEFPDADLIVAADGLNSKIRNKYAAVFAPDLSVRPNRYIWLGTDKRYDSFTFDFRKTEHGWFQAHIYRFDETLRPSSSRRPKRFSRLMALTRWTSSNPSLFARRFFQRRLRAIR